MLSSCGGGGSSGETDDGNDAVVEDAGAVEESGGVEEPGVDQPDDVNPANEMPDDDIPVNNPEPSAPIPDPYSVGSFQLDFINDRFTVVEGQNGGIVIPIGVSRIDSHIRSVQLEVLPETPVDGENVRFELDHNTLEGQQLYTSLRLHVDIGVHPIRSHERRFTVKASDGEETFSRTLILTVNPVQAADVYLLIGQSNMEGSSRGGTRESGEGEVDAVHPRIEQLNVRQNNRGLFDRDELFTSEQFNTMEPRFILAEEPLHEPRFAERPEKGGEFIGPGLAFGKAALAGTTQKIILVPAAWSATGFCGNEDPALAWNVAPTDEPALGGTLLVERALTRLNMTLRDSGGILRGVLWHQGEADSSSEICSIRYEENLIKLIARLRTDARVDLRGASARGPDAAIPFILGTMSRGDDERGNFSQFSDRKQRVDYAHRNIPNRVRYTATAIADDLVPPAYPCGQSSCVHFGVAAYRELGQRYYQALERSYDNR
ncbi:MAG: sialate O-acetylesterase [Granulosicoccus sp.]|nr:sialate O-acetylesterase [Granulosicoccus sp.]